MQRSKKILLVSHCILNQNTVIENEARAEGAILSAIEWALKRRLGFYSFLVLNSHFLA